MGNKLARTTQVSASEYYLHDLPSTCNLVLKEVLGGGRFFKSVLCLHDEGLLLVKVYFKRGEFTDLKEHERRLYRIREHLRKIEHSHVWPFQYWLETDKAAYLLRQYFFSNLHDRISTRPFLSMIEKKWLAFQLLLALKQSHERGVCHGDIKCENVLVTSWNWLYLADFASFKPTYLPVDNPADFSFFFDTGGRRRCYLAPERFYEPGEDVQKTTNAPLKPAMDIFSLGCVIAELFLEGQALFDLSQLLAYRRGQYDPCPSLQKVLDPGIRDMILHMIQLDPESRFSSEQYMQNWAPLIFPAYFSPLLHSFFSCLLPLDTDTRVAVTQSAFSEICKQMIEGSSNTEQKHSSGVGTDTVRNQISFKGEQGKSAEPQALQKPELQISKGGDKGDGSGSVPLYAQSRSLSSASHLELISDISALLRDGHSGSKLVPGGFGDPSSSPVTDLKKGRGDNFFGGSNSSSVFAYTSGGKRISKRAFSPLTDGKKISYREFFLNKSSPSLEGLSSEENLAASTLDFRPTCRVKAAAVAMANAASAASATDETVTEEVFENQVRDPGGVFSERPLHSGECMDVNGSAGLWRRKEDVTLPLEGGWRWHGDWEVDLSWSQTDDEGWRYRSTGSGNHETDTQTFGKLETGKGSRSSSRAAGSRSWTAVCTSDCVWRQRRWIRRRKHSSCLPILLSCSSDLQVMMQKEQLCAPQHFGSEPGKTEARKCEGVVLIASLLCASVRNVKLPQARRGAVQLLHESSLHIDDDARLQHVLPYVVALLSDPAAIVRCAALQTVCNVLSLVQNFPPSDAKIFPEYILPLLSMLPDDPEESVRICYADNVHKIAETACRFLECSQYMTELGVLDKSVHSLKGPTAKSFAVPSLQHRNGRYNSELAQLQETIARVIQELVMGQKQTPAIRRALLQHVGKLCDFFGPKQCNDFLLPILPAFLNDRDEQLRAVFFEQIVHVCLFVGQTSVEAYLLPYIEQALSDVEETVIVNALECLAALCINRLLRKRVLLGAVERAAPLLCHPSRWVRRSAITFVASAGANLELADSHAFLSPILSPFLRREPVSLCLESALLACLKPPMSREAFNRVLSDVMLLQTASETTDGKNVNQQSRGRQRPVLQQLPPDTSQTRASLERRRVEREGSNTASISESKNLKTSPVRWSPLLGPVLQGDHQFTELDDGEKMKAMEEYIRNLSSTMQTRMHNWEMENSEKLQSSVIGMNAGVGAGFYSNYDGSSEGIPLYSVPLSEKRAESQTVPSFSEEWSRIARHGAQPFHMATLLETPLGPHITSSQWAEGHSSMPTGNESLRQPGMTGSFSTKLMSGSVYSGSLIGPRRVYEVIRDVHGREGDPGYMSSSFSRTLSASRGKDTSAPEISPQGFVSAIEPGMAAVQSSDGAIGQSYSGSSMADSQWRPRGVLIAHLQEHQRTVNEVAVSHDNSFFVSASDDGSVKVWDCRKLESNISFRSRLTYSLQGGRALRVNMLGTGPQVAVASSSGTIHVFGVDYVARVGGSVERYSGISDVRKVETQEGAVLSLQSYSNDGPPMLLFSTQRNGIHLWDLRAQNDVWVLKVKPVQGYISATAVGSCYNWLVTATSRGVLTLWDLRFQIPVNTWQHPLSCPVESMRPLVSQSDSSPATSSRPFVYVAAGRDEVALWNAEDGSCHQVLRLAYDGADSEVSEVPAALAQRPKLATTADSKRNECSKRSDYRLDELNEPPPRLTGIRALLPLSGGTGLLTGGTDCKIRMWDLPRPDRSYCVCGPSIKSSAASDTYAYDSRVVAGVQVIQEICNRPQGSKNASKSCIAAAATDTVGCHRDSVLSLASAQTNQRLLISSCRDGSIKVWR